MKLRKSNLDERQEEQLLRIEEKGCWFAFWTLLVSMFVQMAIFGVDKFQYIAGEWVVFMGLALYLAISSMRAGIWDRRLKPNGKTNFLVSLGAAVVFGAVFAVVNYFNFHAWQAALITFFLTAILLFVTIFAALSLSVFLYQKRVKALEEAPEE